MCIFKLLQKIDLDFMYYTGFLCREFRILVLWYRIINATLFIGKIKTFNFLKVFRYTALTLMEKLGTNSKYYTFACVAMDIVDFIDKIHDIFIVDFILIHENNNSFIIIVIIKIKPLFYLHYHVKIVGK